ncbi:MAG: universal stress protein, partial [Deltaproteobacteria bacterium]|nr:universal stress protein [Deltaproteobacteria bacterium]
ACMVMRHAGQNWYKPSFKTPAYPLVPILGFLGCIFVMAITSRPTILIGLGIISVALIWYILYLHKRTQLVGASNVLWHEKIIEPLVEKAEDYKATRRKAFPVILLPLANPETEKSLLMVGTALAKSRRARLHLAHIVSVPAQTPLEVGRMDFEKRRQEQKTILDIASKRAAENGVRTRANTLVAHNVPSAILSVAELAQSDMILLGWKGEVRNSPNRGTNVIRTIKAVNSDVLVLKDKGLDVIRRILVPIGSGPHSNLGLRVAKFLATHWGSTITAMTVQVGKGYPAVKSEFDHTSLQYFQDLDEETIGDILRKEGVTAEISVVVAANVYESIIKASLDYDLIIIGASNEWGLRQWLFGSLPDKVANSASASVLMVRSKA